MQPSSVGHCFGSGSCRRMAVRRVALQLFGQNRDTKVARLQACTPCTTPSFRTSMISSTVAPALNAFLMWCCVRERWAVMWGHLGRFDQRGLQMFVALLRDRCALHRVRRTLLIAAQPAVADGFLDGRDTL